MAVKNAHTVTKGYLKGFTIKGKSSAKMICVYDKEKDGKPSMKSIKKYPTEEFYYAQEDEAGKLTNDAMEQALGDVENFVIPLIRGIKWRPGQKVELPQNEIEYLAFFVAISLTRVPSVREPLRKLREEMAKRVFNNLKDGKKLLEPPDILKGKCIEIVVKNWATLEPMVTMADEISKSMLTKYWEFFLPAPGLSFVSSDNPVLFKGKEDEFAGPGHPSSEICMPLRKDMALVCSPLIKVKEAERSQCHGRIIQFDEKETARFNRDLVWGARRYVFADIKSKELIKLVSEFKDNEQTISFDGFGEGKIVI